MIAGLRTSVRSASVLVGVPLALLYLASGAALAEQERDPSGTAACGSLKNAYGPFDYADARNREKYLPIVEVAHFTEKVRELRDGETGALPGDIEYTLRAFPNHHLALDAIARFYRREKKPGVLGTRPLACWFDRARRMNPDDGMVPMIYGIHFFYLAEFDRAEEQLLTAEQLMPDSPEVHYNLGLVYVKEKNYEAARREAKDAYAQGYPLKGLRDQLTRVGEWRAE